MQHDQHRLLTRLDQQEEIALPTMSLDYRFLGDSETRAADDPILVVYENRTRTICVWQVYQKGTIDWAAQEVADITGSICYDHIRISLKSDKESSIIGLKKLISQKRSAPTTLIESPTRESSSNGAMEVRV